MCLCVLVCVNFGDEILLKGKNVKPWKISNFQEKWQNNNCHNGSRKPRKFSRSRMTKRTIPNHLVKSSDPEKFRRILIQS